MVLVWQCTSVTTGEQTFLCMTGEDPLAFPSDNVPDAHMSVVTPRNKRSSSSGEGTNRVFMPLQMKLVVRVFVHILLYKYCEPMRRCRGENMFIPRRDRPRPHHSQNIYTHLHLALGATRRGEYGHDYRSRSSVAWATFPGGLHHLPLLFRPIRV